jgi:type II secretory pathway predicted ATPase ExeA
MYESYYGFAEKPFSLTPDPKYLYRSESHANAFELLQYAIARREGFAVVTGDIGTGKTTLCRALLERIDDKTCTALVLNPFLSEEELLKRILHDFGVAPRPERSPLDEWSKQELLDALSEFLLGLVPSKSNAVLIIDEAQNLPMSVLEQIRMLSNLETDKDKLLQIVLVGQLNLVTLLRQPELRQLDQRISIRYRLEPLNRESVAAYVVHRLAIAGGSASVTFAPEAIDRVHSLSGGIPRVINLICDRALLAAFSVRENRITADMVAHAGATLDLQTAGARVSRWATSLAGAAALTLAASALAVGATAFLYQRVARASVGDGAAHRDASRIVLSGRRRPPRDARFSVLVGTFPASAVDGDMRSLTERLESSGFEIYDVEIDLGSDGKWHRLLAGAYTDIENARQSAGQLGAVLSNTNARIVDIAPLARAESRP